MSSNRTESLALPEVHHAQDWEKSATIVEPQANLVPPLMKPYAQLDFPCKQFEDKNDPTSKHRNNRAVIKNKQLTKTSKFKYKNEKQEYEITFTHFFKRYRPIPITNPRATIAELEAAISALYKLLAPGCTPTYRVYFEKDENNNIFVVGTSSRAIPNFKDLSEEPLDEKDLIVKLSTQEPVEEEITNLSLTIDGRVNNILDRIHKRNNAKNIFRSYASHYFNIFDPAVSGNFETNLKLFQNKKQEERFKENTLQDLIENVTARSNHIIASKLNVGTNEAAVSYEAELKELKLLKDKILSLLELINRKIVPFTVVPYLERLAQEVLEKNIDLDKNPFEELPFEYFEPVANDNANSKKSKPHPKSLSIQAQYLKNFIRIRNIATTNVATYVLQNVDNHVHNQNNFGMTLDFDMANHPFTFYLRDNSVWEDMFRKPPEEKHQVLYTLEDMEHFPNIKADFYFWPTRFRKLETSVLKGASMVYPIPENHFPIKHTQLIQNLEFNPIAIYFTTKSFLRYALLTKPIFEAIYRLHIRKDAKVVDSNYQVTDKNIIDAMATKDSDRLQTIRLNLINCSHFQNLTPMQAEEMNKSIQQEFNKYKEKINQKIIKLEEENKNGATHSLLPYQNLLDAMNLEIVDAGFREILMGANKVKGNKKNIVPVDRTPVDTKKKNLIPVSRFYRFVS